MRARLLDWLFAALVVVAALLLGGAYLAVRPWLDCTSPLGEFIPSLMQLCSFGTGNPAFDRAGPGPLWWRPILAAAYVIAAVWVARRDRFG